MTHSRALRLVRALSLALIVLLGIAACLTSWLAHSVPAFNRYILLVPLLKPFRYYPPDPADWVQPPMPEAMRLSKSHIASVKITALAESEHFSIGPQRLVSDVTLTHTGAVAEELAMGWNAQSLDCDQGRPLCFSPIFALDFLMDDGSRLHTKLCWSCSGADVELRSPNSDVTKSYQCTFYNRLPQAKHLSNTLHRMMRSLSTVSSP